MEARTISFEDERPLTALPQPDWNENYYFQCHDGAANVGFTIMIGRWHKNTDLWREQLCIYLPDGKTLYYKGIGPSPDPTELSGGMIHCVCEEPGKRWRLSFNGPMRLAELADFQDEPVKEGVPEHVTFDAVWESANPVAMSAASNNTTYGNYHYEQMGRTTGEVHLGGEAMAFSAFGHRDHSRGPRKLSALDAAVVMQIYLPGEDGYALYQVWTRADSEPVQALDQGMLAQGGALKSARLVNNVRLPSAPDMSTMDQPVAVEIEGDGGKLSLMGTPLNTLMLTFGETYEWFFGHTPSLAEFTVVRQPMRFTGDGVELTGFLARTARVSGGHLGKRPS